MTQPNDMSTDQLSKRMLDDARQRLLDTGTRNRLVHVNRENQRARAVNVVNERSDDVHTILTRGRTMKFWALGKDKTKASEQEGADRDDAPVLAAPQVDVPFDEARYSDNKLETMLGPDAQHKRLLSIAREARTVEEEQGVNVLYLAMGFLAWFEDKASAEKREAPLILLPVQLVRNAKTSAYDVRVRDDEILTNLPLQQRLLEQGVMLPDIDTEQDDWSPEVYFQQVAEAVDGKTGGEQRVPWSIDRNGMQLGFFSFAKLLMMRDLDPDNWPEGALEGSELLAGVLHEGFPEQSPLFASDARLDELFAPSDLMQIVDADASQTKVIEEVRAGRNLVVQGPPGTGKSQTIANIIAAAVHDGKTVLFMAEKMAALSVVNDRLHKVGLRDIALELHSRAANKKTMLQEMARTLTSGAAVSHDAANVSALQMSRDRLNAIDASLHRPVDGSGDTAFSALSTIVSLQGSGMGEPQYELPDLARVGQSATDTIEENVVELADRVARFGPRDAHPLRGTRALSLTPIDTQRLKREAGDAAEAVAAMQASFTSLSQMLGMPIATPADFGEAIRGLHLLATATDEIAAWLPAVLRSKQHDRWPAALQAVKDWAAHAKDAASYSAVAWHVPIDHLRSPLVGGTGAFYTRWMPSYRRASRELGSMVTAALPATASDRVALFDRLSAARRAKADVADHHDILMAVVGDAAKVDAFDTAAFERGCAWLARVQVQVPDMPVATIVKMANAPSKVAQMAEVCATRLQAVQTTLRAVQDRLDLDISRAFGTDDPMAVAADALQERMSRIGADEALYDGWRLLAESADALDAASLGVITASIERGEMTGARAVREVRFSRAEAIWKAACQSDPTLDRLALEDRHALVEMFQTAEQDRLHENRRKVVAEHLAQLPSGGIGEMGYLRGQMAKKSRHDAIRRMISTAGSMVQRIKPVLLMSPISVAQYLAPGDMSFDLLVIDEASQVRPEDAFGAIARCRQIVVVGDKQQLPPTAFFDRLTANVSEDDEDEAALPATLVSATEMESVLTLCDARQVPSRMLEWHYRSRDPSLITVSNKEFYEGRLILPPSPLAESDGTGLTFTRVAGAYSSATRGTGTPGTNRIEAEAIAAAVAQHARTKPDWSLGVVAFSVKQRNMITEMLEYARRNDPVLDAFLREGRAEDVFVKNIENVQGDERDVILISVGYGPNEPNARLASMSFGPVNSDGGERRLNVLFSRARIRCEVFASFDPGDIDAERTRHTGVRVLKRFLEFAKTGQITEARPTGQGADSPFETDVAREIEKAGYRVALQVGSAGFKIDIAVRHPQQNGTFMLAVECDGATYHSALWARERDRLRQSILEDQGWRFHRIWSTDWFHRRHSEIERLRAALEEAAAAQDTGLALTGANDGIALPEPADPDVPDVAEPATVEPTAFERADVDLFPVLKAATYVLAKPQLRTDYEPHDAPAGLLKQIVREIVMVEGPIHQQEIARRLAASFGKERAGQRIFDVTLRALRAVKGRAHEQLGDTVIDDEDAFWFTLEQKAAPPVRNRSKAPGTVQKADHIAAMEIAAAVGKLLEESGSAPVDDVVRATARLLGFDRVGSSLKTAIEAQVLTFVDADSG